MRKNERNTIKKIRKKYENIYSKQVKKVTVKTLDG